VSTLLAGALLATLAAAASPPAANAGAYYVRSCFPDGISGIWSRYRNNGYADAYAACPEGAGGNHGLYARNVFTPNPAPAYSAAMLYVNAPPGTYIDALTFEAFVRENRGWLAGLYDRQHNRWVWCGPGCGTSWIWGQYRLGLSTNSLAIMVICAASECPSDSQLVGSISLRNVTMRLQDYVAPSVAITGGTLATGGWKRGVQSVTVSGSDNVGVRILDVFVDGKPHDHRLESCDDHRLVTCPTSVRQTMYADTEKVTDGRHSLTASAVDAGGARSTTSRTIFVDNTAPGPVERLLGDTDQWIASNSFNLRWINPEQGGTAPIAGVVYELCPLDSALDASCRTNSPINRPAVNGLTGIRVPDAGAWRLRLWLRDAAGNDDSQTSRDATLRWDPEPPTVNLKPRDPHDPARIAVAASDKVSDIASTEIELRRQGDTTWHSLPVVRSADGFSAVVDDEVFPPGRYAIRARARDLAGNERSTGATGATIDLPARLPTELAVGHQSSVRAGSRRPHRVLVRRPLSRFGRSILLRGRLASPGGNPLAGRDVDISERSLLGGSPWRPVATVRTGRSGRFAFRAPPGPSRLIRFRYPGSATIQGRTGTVELHVRAASGFRASRRRVVNGEDVVFRGRVWSGPLPETGKLLQLQVYARRSWLTFATPRANQRGRWRYRYRFTATRGTTRYRFRVRIPRESGYPYDAGASRSVSVTVRGT
jgi:hypothetical protein